MQQNIRRERFTVQWETRPTKPTEGGRGFTTDFAAPVTVHTQDVIVEVDMGEIARRLGTKAAKSAGGRAVAVSGLVKVKADKGTRKSQLKGAR